MMAGGVNLPTTTSPTAGVITQNGTPLMHTFGPSNFFAGPGAGNFTKTGAGLLTLNAASTMTGQVTIKGSTIIFKSDAGVISTHTLLPVAGTPVTACSVDTSLFTRVG